MASKKGSKRAPSKSKGGIKGLAAKRLKADESGAVKGGRRADGTGGGNVTGGWDLTSNKIHA